MLRGFPGGAQVDFTRAQAVSWQKRVDELESELRRVGRHLENTHFCNLCCQETVSTPWQEVGKGKLKRLIARGTAASGIQRSSLLAPLPVSLRPVWGWEQSG